MKNLSKALSLALAGVIFTSVAAFPANAYSLSQVKDLKVVSSEDDELNLKWSKVSGASGYQIQYRTENGKWKTVEYTNKTKDDIDDLKSATVYEVRVRAYKKLASKRTYGKYSSSVKTVTDPNEPKSLSFKKLSSSKIKLSWKAVSKADGYRIYKYNKSTSSWERVAKTTDTSKTLSVSSKETERFRVKAYKVLSNKYYYSDASNSVTCTASPQSASSITKAKAKEIALKDAGLSKVYDYDIEKEKVKGSTVYEIDFKSGRYEYEYVIDAVTGDILHREKSIDD